MTLYVAEAEIDAPLLRETGCPSNVEHESFSIVMTVPSEGQFKPARFILLPAMEMKDGKLEQGERADGVLSIITRSNNYIHASSIAKRLDIEAPRTHRKRGVVVVWNSRAHRGLASNEKLRSYGECRERRKEGLRMRRAADCEQ